ncbi:MAG: threonine--tRNA ligase, partial [Candidatus Aenigmarchaeota archaeon]|nr:threonine--tRNA ligase [Candidatus Aenigmarchaeota archaeon]
IYGSLERFIGILVEHYAGKFPVWLSPVQAKILTVADRFEPYAKKVKTELEKDNIRIEIDSRSETLDKKVRDAQLEKVPYIIVVGQKDMDKKTITIRTREGVVEGAKKVADFKKRVLKEIRDKKTNP